MAIGAVYDSSSNWFNGSEKDVLIVNRTFSDDEVMHNYLFNNTILHQDATSLGDVITVNTTINDGIGDGNSLEYSMDIIS